MHEKGVDELFAAAKRMKQEYGDGVEFHIVGSFEEGYKPLMDELEQAGVVKYHGYQSDMKHFYAMASCVVLPSYHEGMSMCCWRLPPRATADHQRHPRLP